MNDKPIFPSISLLFRQLLEEELDKLKKKVAESTTKSSNLTDINSAYHADIKIHKRIEGKLKKELEYSDDRRRQAETELEDQRKVSEKVPTGLLAPILFLLTS